MNSANSPVESSVVRTRADSFLPLLIALIAMLMLAPLLNSLPLLAYILVAAVLLSGVYAVRHDRLIRVTVMSGLAICFPLRTAAQLIGDQYPAVILLSHLTAGMYFAILTVVVLIRVIAHQEVTSQTVIGAVCGYLLIGYVFTFGYMVMVFLDPAAITINGTPIGAEASTNIGQHMAELIYFSFISLTTVGYGDIVPVNPVARMLAVIEILTGQLYLAAFVARLVGSMSGPAANPPQS